MKKLMIPIIVLAVSFLFPILLVKAEGNSEEFKINSEFKCSKLKLKADTYISDYKYEDVTGDGVKDDIILVGYRRYDASCSLREKILVVVRDGNTEKYYAVSPGKIDGGISGSIFTGDFDGDRVSDIMVTIGTGGSGGCSWYSVFSFKKHRCKYLFEEEGFSKGFDFEVVYKDNYQIEVLNKSIKKLYVLDAENKKDTYTGLGIYSAEGRLLKLAKGSFDMISSLVPVDVDNDGVYELKSIQAVWGICHADTLGYAKTIWKYNSNKMEPQEFNILEFATPGNRQKKQKVIPVWAN